MKTALKPNVLCLSGLDPTGGAGIQADIEALGAFGAHALPLISCLTVQDTCNVLSSQAVDMALLGQQLAALQVDCRIEAMKMGLLGALVHWPLLQQWVAKTRMPMVLDPILRAGGGATLMQPSDIAVMRESLFPFMTLITPNAREARWLTGLETAEAAGEALSLSGPRHVLVTGGDEPGGEVLNHWFSEGRLRMTFRWPRIAGEFHGAGCTLASAAAACLALGDSMESALERAQRYTHACLSGASPVGQGRWVPNRNRVAGEQDRP